MKPTETMRDIPETCARVVARLDEHLDGGLAPLEAARDAGHLEVCGVCVAERGRRARERELLRAALSPPAAELAAARVGLDERLAAARAPGRRSVLHLVTARAATWAGLAAASLLAVVLLEASGLVEGGLHGLLGGAHGVVRDAELPSPDFDGVLTEFAGEGGV